MNGNQPKNPNPKNAGPAKPADPKAQPARGAAPQPAAPAHVPPLYRRIDWWCFAVTTLLVFAGYWWTLAPDLTLEDCGELAVASKYAGVPHPPGYPVWTIYTWLFTVLLPVSNIAYRVAISSAVAGALACGLVALMVSRGSSMILEGIAELKNVEKKVENALCLVSGFVAGMLIGFNGFMWSQAVIVEVYTLSVLSMTGVLACLLRWIYAPHQRRYLYLAFFWFGICFNNHQSLLVLALGLEVAIVAAAPRLGRDLFFWNSIIYIGGLFARGMGMMSLLNDNLPLLFIYHAVGLVSIGGWIFLFFKTRMKPVELGRDLLLLGSLGYLAVLFLHITGFSGAFEFKRGLFMLFNLAGVACIGGFIYVLGLTRALPRDWLAALGCGAAWTVGAAFYLYMALASMSNPPLNWGYPRTVQGFFHAFTRGQYERIHPTQDLGRYIDQIFLYVGGVLEEFNLIYVLIAFIPFFFFKKMQPRERAWLVGLTAVYLMLSFFLLILLNPAPDRQSRDLNRVFFTASHFMIAMGTGYGLTLLGAFLSTQYERFRKLVLGFGAFATVVALFLVAVTFQGENALINVHWSVFDLLPSYSPLVRFTALFSLALAAAGTALFLFWRTRAPMAALLVVFAIMPVRSILSHWSDNEQRGHYFGYWFGHDMFTPPFTDPKTGKLTYDAKLRAELLKTPEGRLIYPEMDRDTVLYGGTDPGRFNPTYMIFCESFIPESKRNSMNPVFDRRDVYLITQNALADGTYLNYIRAHYNRSAQIDPPFFSELVRGPKELEKNEHTNFVARLLRPVDRFFLGLGDRIEMNRRCGSSFFTAASFTNAPALAAKLKAAADPLSKHLRDQLSEDTQKLLDSGNSGDSALKKALAKDLNRVLETGPLYDTNRFAHVTLSERTQRFTKKDRTKFTRVRLNRTLLEEAYPAHIERSLGGVYPDFEIDSATNEDSQRCFQEYLADAQKRLDHDRRNPTAPRQIKPGEDVRIIDNRVQVSGQVAVMAINGLLTKVIFDKNPEHEFYVEESFPLDWMYPHLTPHGVIMKINRNPLPELTQDILDRDHHFWKKFSDRLMGDRIDYDTPVSNICAFAEQVYYRRKMPKDFKGDPKFIRDSDGQKAFSKLRSSIAGVYDWRVMNAKSLPERDRMYREAEFAFKQAYAFCPYSPEAIFRFVNLLLRFGRIDDALLLAKTSQKLDPFNGQIENLIVELMKIKAQHAAVAPQMPPPPGQSPAQALAQLEQQSQAQPDNLMLACQLAGSYLQAQQNDKALAALDRVVAHPKADANALTMAANFYAQAQQLPRIENALVRLVALDTNSPESRFDLAAIQAMLNKPTNALDTLRQALRLSADRLKANPAAANLHATALTDQRFAALRQSPDFQKVLDEFKASPK
jgi:tetratricopeptide (TPR) repeat protein